MRIAFFDFVTHFGGAQRSTIDLASRIKDKSDLLIIDPYGACSEYLEAMKRAKLSYYILSKGERRTVIGGQGNRIRRLLSIARSLPGLYKIRQLLKRSLKQHHPDVIWTSSAKALAILGPVSEDMRVPIIFYARGNCRPQFLPRWARRVMIRYSKVVVVLYKGARKYLEEMGISSDRVEVIPNAVDIPNLRENASGPLAEPLPGDARKIRLLLPATLLPTKGQCCAVRALGRLVSSGYDAILYLAGNIPKKGDMGYLDNIRAVARELRIADRVFLLGWREDIPSIMMSSTMVILPSHSEGMPRCIMEAMALGCPVAATPVGGVPDLLIPGQTGWSFDIEDDKGLANAVIVASDRRVSDKVVVRASKHIASFTPEIQTERMLRTLGKAIGR